MIGTTLFIIGTTAFFPMKSVYRLSLGFIQIPVSATMVSGRVVAIIRSSEPSSSL